MGNFRVRRCHKCKYTLKSKNLVQLKDGKPLCEIYKNGIPDEIFFKGKYCSKFELARKYNIVHMIENLIKKFKNRARKWLYFFEHIFLGYRFWLIKFMA